MREIKFRAWDGKEMVPNALYAEWNDPVEFDGLQLDGYYTPGFTGGGIKAIMQFTGLKDKNGVEIYEGDIVKYPADDRARLFPVQWVEKDAEFRGKNGQIYVPARTFLNYEVIGNIHEHKELLDD